MRKERRSKRKPSFIDFCILAGDTELVEKVRNFCEILDRYNDGPTGTGSNLLQVFDALYNTVESITNAKIDALYGISEKPLNAFIEKINSAAMAINNSLQKNREVKIVKQK